MNSETVSTAGGFVRATGTEADVCRDIARRQALGVTKYGTTVRENPLTVRAWLQQQYEELLDAAVYCKRAMEEMDKAVPEQSGPYLDRRSGGRAVKVNGMVKG